MAVSGRRYVRLRSFFVLCLGVFAAFSASAQFGSAWVQVKQNAGWPTRNAFGSAVFDNRLWIMGGAEDGFGGLLNDVWSSTDGVNWTQVTASANWSPRRDFVALGFGGFLWVIGGQNNSTAFAEVWRSTDGANWTQVTAAAAFGEVILGTAVIYDSNMWLIGGFDFDSFAFSDSAWRSTDGATWTEAGTNLPWAARSGLSSTVFNDRIYILGGSVFNFQSSSFSYFGDVWSSNNGSNWTQSTAAAAWPARDSATAVSALGRIWIMGGFTNDGAQRDVWNSTDGVTWTQAISQAPWPRRVYPQSQQFNNRLYIMGGANSADGVLNDVWYSAVGGQILGNLTSSADSSPVTCCAVLIVGPGYRRVAVADVNGFYQQDEVPAGNYTLTFFAPGFASKTASVTVSANARTFSSQSFTPATTGTFIRGQVTDNATGLPVPAIRVRLLVGSTPIAVTYTCAEGRYEFRNPPFKGGTVDVEFSDDIDNGYDAETQTIPQPAPGTATTVDEGMNKSVNGPATLIGTVTSSEAGAISGARVTIEGIANASVTTPGNGIYTFDSVPTGAYSVRASAEGFTSIGQIASVTTGVSQLNFVLSPGNNNVPGDVNGDGVANAADIQSTINAALGINTGFDNDLNMDGSVNAVDVQLQINIVLGVA